MTHFERCDERLQNAITRTADKLSNELWNIIFNHLDSHSGRFLIDGEDAGALAKVAVDSIYEKIKEALAK